jgi:hypothetical protein
MKAVLDNWYTIEVVEAKLLSEYDEIRITYNRKLYPELGDYFKDKFMKKETLIYKDEMQECAILIDGASFSLGITVVDKDDDEDVDSILNAKIYGEAGKNIPFEKQEDFIKYQAYGTLRFQKIKSNKKMPNYT